MTPKTSFQNDLSPKGVIKWKKEEIKWISSRNLTV